MTRGKSNRKKEEAKAPGKAVLPPWTIVAALSALLALAAFLLYRQTFTFSFVSLDDLDYVPQNPFVSGGLTLDGITAAFSSRYQNFWIPATWISYMADVELWGMNAGAMHRTNVILFAASSVLLFAFLRALTGSLWRSFFVAALWTVHPLRVESVAWITERKDLLVGLFFVAALWSHLNWSRTRRPVWLAALFCFALLGFMSKPVMVVLPAALLLLDFWPLGRFNDGEGKFSPAALKGLLIEKAPVIALSLLFGAVTVYTQLVKNLLPSKTDAVNLSIAAISYLRYLERTFWPAGMFLEKAQFRTTALIMTSVAAALFLAALTWGAWKARKKAPELLFGWLWFLLVLLPNSGIVSIGLQTYSDRFSYLPHIGLFAALVFGAGRLAEGMKFDFRFLAAPAVIAIVALSAVSYRLTTHWRDSITLFTQADEVSGGTNAMAKSSLAIEYLERGDLGKALYYLNETERIQPYYPFLKYNMALVLHRMGRDEEALRVINQDACPQAKDKTLSMELRAEIIDSLKEKRR